VGKSRGAQRLQPGAFSNFLTLDLVGRYAYLGVFSPGVGLVKGLGVCVCACFRAFPVVVVQRQAYKSCRLVAGGLCMCVCGGVGGWG